MMTKRFSNRFWQKVPEIFFLLILLLEIDPVWMRAQTGSLPGDILHQEDQLVVNHFQKLLSHQLVCFVKRKLLVKQSILFRIIVKTFILFYPMAARRKRVGR